MRALLFVSVYALALAGCATTTQSQWQQDVSAIQASVPIAENIINAVPGVDTAYVAKVEAQLNGEVAALTGTPAPQTATLILQDMQTLIAALPPSALSPQHQSEISAALALAKLLAAYA